jgi:restriction system protein
MLEAFTAMFSITYIFWPLLILFGLRILFKGGQPFAERIRKASCRIFVGWVVWAFFVVFIYWQGRKPILIMPEIINHVLFIILGAVSGGITIGSLIYRIKTSRIRLKDAQTLEDLLAMPPEKFEALIAVLFKAYGHRVEVVGGNSDHGVDVAVMTDQGEKWVVQCKRYSGSVGEPVVRDLYGTMLHEEAQRAFLITTGSFTQQAHEWAEGKPIVLYDGEGLVRLIRRTQERSGHRHQTVPNE